MFKDISGQRFGKLTAIKMTGKTKSREILWGCLCDCGKKIITRGASLRNGHTISCGCSWQHGFKNTRIYNIFCSIKQRCSYSKYRGFENYGGRGIKCLWKSFEEFRDDMLASYNEHVATFGQKQTQIDRIDNSGDYSKENCHWVTLKEQARNRRNNHIISFQGKTMPISAWGELLGLRGHTILQRIYRDGWSIKKALSTPAFTGRNQFTK